MWVISGNEWEWEHRLYWYYLYQRLYRESEKRDATTKVRPFMEANPEQQFWKGFLKFKAAGLSLISSIVSNSLAPLHSS